MLANFMGILSEGSMGAKFLPCDCWTGRLLFVFVKRIEENKQQIVEWKGF